MATFIYQTLSFLTKTPLQQFREPIQQVCQRCQLGAATLPVLQSPWQHMQVRGRYADWRMLRDVKRRACMREYAVEKLRINAIRRNNILPPVIQEMATKEITSLPRDAHRTRFVNRCVITSRPRGLRKQWRISRIMWRHFADYNKLSGVTRSWW